MFNSSLMNELIRIERVSAIRLPPRLMDVTSPMSKNGRVGEKVYRGVATANVLMYNLPFYCLSRIEHKKCCPSFASPQLLDSSMTLVKEEKTKT